MKRFRGILAFAFLLISFSISGFSQDRKNVLFLMADDYNYWTSAIGYYPQARTPHIDSLAARGVLFMDAQCSSPVCNPSRNALWSGLRPSTTQISSNSGGYVRDKLIGGRKIFANITSLHQYFKENGYHAYAAGKLWHPGKMGSTETDPKNWSQLNTTGTGCDGGSLYKYDVKAKSNYGWSANASALSSSNCNDYNMARQVANFISGYDKSTNKDKPFFIGCGFFRPHMPWNSPVEFWNLFNPDSLIVPPAYNAALDEPGNNVHQEISAVNALWMQAIQAYLASMALADSNVAVVLEALDNSPYKDNTIVLFMGDHGWHLGEKGHWGKFSTWDEANHTTLIIYDPSARGNGKECTHVVSLQDLYPTLIELCGLPPKKDIEGRSIASLLDAPDTVGWDWPALMMYGDNHYIKTNEWRFLDDGNDSRLHRHTEDPHRWNNLYGKSEYNGIVTILKAKMDSMRQIGYAIRDSLQVVGVDKVIEEPVQRPLLMASSPIDNYLLLDLLYTDPMVRVEIYDIKGNLLQDDLVEGEQQVSLPLRSEMASGIYFVRVNNSEGYLSDRFIVR